MLINLLELRIDCATSMPNGYFFEEPAYDRYRAETCLIFCINMSIDTVFNLLQLLTCIFR